MKYARWFLTSLFLLAACEASDMHFEIQQVTQTDATSQTSEVSGTGIDLSQDQTIVVKEDPLTMDADHDGYPAFGDCNDNDASIHPGLPTCPTIEGADKTSYKLVLVYGDAPEYTPYMSALYYKFSENPEFSSKTFFDESWLGGTFSPRTFVAMDLDKNTSGYTVAFNVADYPSVWTVCEGSLVKKIDLKLTLPKVYLITGGIWKDVTSQIKVLPAYDLEIVDFYDGDTIGLPAKCAAALAL